MDSKRQSKTLSVIPTNANEKGIVLIGAIALIAILALLGTVGVITTSTEIMISKNHKTSVQARYVSEAGIHRTIGMLNSSPGWLEGLDPVTINAFPGDISFGNGTCVVDVYKNSPTTGKIRIITEGKVGGSFSEFEAIVIPRTYEILDYATFDCGGLDLKASENNVITGDVYVNGTIDLEESGIQQIQGDVYATGDIVIGGTSSITGNAFANVNIDLLSDASPNIDGNATAGGVVDGTDDWVNKVSGTISDGESPAPVENLCSGDDLADITITSEDIQAFRDSATTTITGTYEYDGNDNFTGIVHITQDFELTADSTFSGAVIFIVDGNVDISGSLTSSPAGSNVIFLVPNGNFKVMGGGDVVIDGTVLVGTIDSDGIKTGGDVKVTGESTNLTVNGNVIAVNGGIDTGSGGTFTVDYQPLDDSNPVAQGGFTMTQLRYVSN